MPNDIWSEPKIIKREKISTFENFNAYFLGDYEWQYRVLGEVTQYINDFISPRTWGKTFHVSTYICPECRNFMYQTNVCGRVAVSTANGKQFLGETFACFNCKKVYSLVKGQNHLGEGCIVMEKRTLFNDLINIIDENADSIDK